MFVFRNYFMPVFRSSLAPQTNSRKLRLHECSNRAAEYVGGKSRGSNARAIILRKKVAKDWGKDGVDNTSFHRIDWRFGHKLSKYFLEFKRKFPDRKILVLDWGCGSGVSAKELAKDPRLGVFGFSEDGHKMHRSPQGAEFLHTTKEVLPRYFRKRTEIASI